ncbi:MAG: alpha amylase C-terminal domain-containing protein [Prevotellaceae bacterium]|jgi:1,4-alpha-glucan branching enzyme|nr:alpha amylase C-terminal domain-containing protein [Prevotellaceae bacterium]
MNDLKLWLDDTCLEPYRKVIWNRYLQAVLKERNFTEQHASLSDACNGHLFYGLHRTADGWVFREWAPNATAIYLIGDFNGWEKQPAWALRPIGGGNWEIVLPEKVIRHSDLYKLGMEWAGGNGERIPAYATRAVQDEQTKLFAAQVWQPARAYRWKYPAPARVQNPLIYEAHIGMSSESERVATFDEFRRQTLPRIVRLGYNVIQLMAIQEHPYYGSFGYQVSNFFAVSSRFGTPDALKRLIDEAHRHGIAVILDLVHSHAVKNEAEGLSCFDGSDYQYFHSGTAGTHPVWNSRLFDYGRDEVVHFLLSNNKFWLTEYRFDGFRFDGVTSMMYRDHGIGRDFTDYALYFDGNQDEDAITYLILANRLIHLVNPNALTIAEDVSGMPGLAAPQADGGMGFDFRMSMGVADFWIKTIKEKRDEDWHVGNMFYELTNKRRDEHTISYAESHDQAMVGDKTIIFRLMDKAMYDAMNVFERNLIVDRGMALHKMIRLLSLATAGDGYLTFMGNEFGHPEWIDFPREGNGWSYRYARRQWSLADNPDLRYRFLRDFEEDMIRLAASESLFDSRPHVIVQHIVDQILIFKRGDLLFIFNFNPVRSFTNYRFPAEAGKYITLLDSDAPGFDGFGRVDTIIPHFTLYDDNAHFLQLYIPNRTGRVLRRIKN